ncbi:MAG TPA: transglycosylase SLT domain-containing protein [Candidatus Bacteroides avicola]|jgi:membrane-bound lytic murein transglycosylase D|uniref:Transglycosylase SLT domain-containing protein n=1 Tax=Candidatus Bacteroides avicola TaxID=2838468 RepID=A0A9D2HTU6_9BACE|nr:transglycosylase SLT domain-containing protein [Candidatus Bacteroides avicola]
MHLKDIRNHLLTAPLFMLYSVLAIQPAHAQENMNIVINENGTQHTDTIDLPAGMTYPLDSLLNDWKAKTYIDLGKDCSTSTTNPLFSDSVYIDRLSRMPVIMEMPYNDIVRKFIDTYTNRLRGQVAFMLSACNFYMPIFEEALDAYNLPLELKYLPIIESALNPSAVSRAGATGLWQFMLATGKLYGLESNSLVDERRDPIKATWAAARYLKDMYDIYKDWNLVIAAYNCGPGNINKAIRRAGGKTDYWEIYNYLPRETRGYVPAFIAANYVMTYYCKHNICPMETNIPKSTDTIQVNQKLHFEQIADICHIPVEEIKSLNPQYKRNIVPGDSKPCILRLPTETISTFIDNQDTIYAHRSKELFKNRRTVASVDAKTSSGSGKVIYYKIRNGDTLSNIASKYGVSVRQLRQWNGLRNNKIRAGKRLKIYR